MANSPDIRLDFTPPTLGATPLSAAQLSEIERAKTRGKKVRRVAAVASTDATISSLFAAMTILSTCMDRVNLFLGVGLAIAAINSLRGAKRLKAMDLTAPRLLALNQMFFALCIMAYAAYSIWQVSHDNSGLVHLIVGSKEDMQMAREAGVDVQSLAKTVIATVAAVYWSLFILTPIFSGLTAWYYLSRRKLLEDYLKETPAWVTDLLRRTAGH